mgnify:FL=1
MNKEVFLAHVKDIDDKQKYFLFYFFATLRNITLKP